MSDVIDDAEDVGRLQEGGARFTGGRFSKQPAADILKKPCRECGVQPVRHPVGTTGKEYMTCPVCGKRTEALKSRQALQVMWNETN